MQRWHHCVLKRLNVDITTLYAIEQSSLKRHWLAKEHKVNEGCFGISLVIGSIP